MVGRGSARWHRALVVWPAFEWGKTPWEISARPAFPTHTNTHRHTHPPLIFGHVSSWQCTRTEQVRHVGVLMRKVEHSSQCVLHMQCIWLLLYTFVEAHDHKSLKQQYFCVEENCYSHPCASLYSSYQGSFFSVLDSRDLFCTARHVGKWRRKWAPNGRPSGCGTAVREASFCLLYISRYSIKIWVWSRYCEAKLHNNVEGKWTV